MISIKNSRFTTVRRAAEEEDKVRFKEAYDLFLKHKAAEEAKVKELTDAKAKLAELEAKAKEPKKAKE